MPFKRDSLKTIQERTYANYISLYKPLDKSPRYNLLKVFASIDAGIYHQLLGDLDYLALQIFPDTATGDTLREHWSNKVPPLFAITAFGNVTMTGAANKTIPAGIVFKSTSGNRYYLDGAYRLDSNGQATVTVKAENPGQQWNLAAGEKLAIVSARSVEIDSQAIVSAPGIIGGCDAETDEEYLIRVLAYLRNPSRYGKIGDFALWARDASPEVSAAWEFKNFGVFGAILVQVIKGNQRNGVYPIDNLAEIRNYISNQAPPILFDVQSPKIISINPQASLPFHENSLANRELAISRMQDWMQFEARPGVKITAGALRMAVIDGTTITDITIKLGGATDGIIATTILEYPYIGEIIWE